MKVAVIGAGYVGLTTSAVFAEKGNDVLCVDNDAAKVGRLKKKIVDIYEPGLDELVRQNMARRRLSFSSSINDACAFAKVIFICVPTPPLPDGTADLSFVENVSRQIADIIVDYHLVVDKSTVPVRTGERVKQIITRYNKSKADFDVASNPEFLREGSAIHDALKPDRIVFGVENKRAEMILRDLFRNFNSTMVVTDINSAEIIKHAANSFLAMKISYANCLAMICDLVNADVKVVAQGMGLDRRIGPDFLEAGIGYGGSCFPKDVKAFYTICRELGLDFRLVKEVENINNEIREYFIKKVSKELWIIKGKKLGVLGLSFKKNTDDIRGSVAIEIVKKLSAMGAEISCYDPKAMPKSRVELSGHKNIRFARGAYDAARGSDAVLILTDWDEFKALDYLKIGRVMKTKIIFDGRNLLDPIAMKSAGFIYRGVGRGYYEKEQS